MTGLVEGWGFRSTENSRRRATCCRKNAD